MKTAASAETLSGVAISYYLAFDGARAITGPFNLFVRLVSIDFHSPKDFLDQATAVSAGAP
ncbi:hypothetical protein [Burkholderia sp. USMB20]|uniref:hypothetical protein n=1 Tax=Burkholderia sp. USMB20 TaxID=1571773 RepID=UPI001091E5E1|nr:hypothetical protein [Burkholderia sp. USMB20]TGN99218.1 hypothetical protein PL79_000695 [Burkholderia sp. USMB20]